LDAKGAPGEGLVVREDYIRYLEAGPRKPGPVLLVALTKIFGSEPVPFEEELPETDRIADAIDRLIEAVKDQTRAINAQPLGLLAAMRAGPGLPLDQIVALMDSSSGEIAIDRPLEESVPARRRRPAVRG
jgi:hypothetical protein